ncbi:MAG: hypothetical protein AB1715_13770 [Acidobacteriota bacterium]
MKTTIPVEERKFSFEVNGRMIQAALTTPGPGGAGWGIVLIAGSGPSDVDGNWPDDPMWPGKTHVYADLGRQFAALGVASLRFGRGDAVTVDEAKFAGHNRFSERIIVAAAAVRALRERAPGLARIAVAGHSEGSVVGSLLLTEREDLDVRAFISLAGPAWRFFDLMLRQIKGFAEDGMLEFGQVKMPLSLYELSVQVVRNAQPVPDYLKAIPWGFHSMPEEGKQYLRDYDSVDNSEVISRVKCPVLLVQGGLDASVLPDNADKLIEARRSSGFRTDKVFFPELDHMFKQAPPGQPFARLNNQEVDERVSRAIRDWLTGLDV